MDGLVEPRSELAQQCVDEGADARVTSTSFYLFLKSQRRWRLFLWLAAALCGTSAAGLGSFEIVSGQERLIPILSLLAVILPGLTKALKLDETILDYEKGASKFKAAQKALERCAKVWSHKPYTEFENEARKAFQQLDEARALSLTPPNRFYSAAKRIDKEYLPDKVE